MINYLDSETSATAPEQEPVMPMPGWGSTWRAIRIHELDQENRVDMGEDDLGESENVTLLQQAEVYFPPRGSITIYTMPAGDETGFLVGGELGGTAPSIRLTETKVRWRNRFSESVSSFLKQHEEISHYLDLVEPKIVSVFGECEIRLEIVSFNEADAHDELSAKILCSSDWEFEMDRLEELEDMVGTWPREVGRYFKFDIDVA